MFYQYLRTGSWLMIPSLTNSQMQRYRLSVITFTVSFSLKTMHISSIKISSVMCQTTVFENSKTENFDIITNKKILLWFSFTIIKNYLHQYTFFFQIKTWNGIFYDYTLGWLIFSKDTTGPAESFNNAMFYLKVYAFVFDM